MKASFTFIALFLIFGYSSSYVNSQGADSCSSTLNLLNVQLPFDTTTFSCHPVWNSQSFILRYSQTSSNVWSFVLSAPNTNSYIAIGFSPDGKMVGSSAIVGWVTTDGAAVMKRYYLGAQSPHSVIPDLGNLQVIGNSSSIVYVALNIYMAFQLSIDQPDQRLIYAVGPTGRLPVASSYLLSEHSNKVSTTLNYASGQSQTQSSYANLKKSHGILNMLGWGILIPMGVMVARYMKQWNPIWFYSHISIQSLGFILGLTGVICGFVLNNRLNINVNKHKGLGIFILTLGCLQVIASLARPDKASKVRKYWNWYHYTLGRVLIFLAAVNIFYGIHLGHAGRGWNAGFGVVLAIFFIVAVVLELRMWMRK